MKDVIVVSYATHRAGLLDEYEAQLAAAGIDFHLETVELEDGINSVTARWKFEFMRRMCERFKEYERIVFTDAWDVLFFGTKADLLKRLPEYLVISAERQCWPDPTVAEGFTSDSPWRFCNAGIMGGNRNSVILTAIHSLSADDLELMEQEWLNKQLSEQGGSEFIDERTEVFYTVSADKEDGSLSSIDGRPWNWTTDTHPQFFHFSGQCPTEPFRRMLETGEPLCASV